MVYGFNETQIGFDLEMFSITPCPLLLYSARHCLAKKISDGMRNWAENINFVERQYKLSMKVMLDWYNIFIRTLYRHSYIPQCLKWKLKCQAV